MRYTLLTLTIICTKFISLQAGKLPGQDSQSRLDKSQIFSAKKSRKEVINQGFTNFFTNGPL